MLDKEFQYYLDHQDQLVEKYQGRFIIIKNQNVIGDYDTIQQAINETEKSHERGTYLVQEVESGQDSYTQHFHSRVTFS